MTTPAGWYDDGSGTQRYWNGIEWTAETSVKAPPPYAAPSTPEQDGAAVLPVALVGLLLKRPWLTAAGAATVACAVVILVAVAARSSYPYSKNELLNAYDSCFSQWEVATSNGTLPPLDPNVGPTALDAGYTKACLADHLPKLSPKQIDDVYEGGEAGIEDGTSR
jgi:hypothetical protein